RTGPSLALSTYPSSRRKPGPTAPRGAEVAHRATMMMPYRIARASGKVDPGFRRDDDLWEASCQRLPPPQPSPASGGGSPTRSGGRVGAEAAEKRCEEREWNASRSPGY